MQSNKAYPTPQFIPQTSPKAAPPAHFNPPQQFMPQQAPGSGGFPGMGHPQQSQAPAAPPKPAAPPAPTGPPANVNISNVDTSKVIFMANHTLLTQQSMFVSIIQSTQQSVLRKKTFQGEEHLAHQICYSDMLLSMAVERY